MSSSYHITPEQQRGFSELLSRVDDSLLNEQIYHDRYLRHLLANKSYFIKIYTQVLNYAIQAVGLAPEKIILVDYGAGNGLLGLFASFCGFGKVILVDSNPSFTGSAARLSECLSLPLYGIVTGEITDLAVFLDGKRPDVMVGTDVIEHIYDLSSFFKNVRQLNPGMITVFTTASNPENPIKTRQLKRVQRKDEYEGGVPEDYVVPGDQLPFIEIRKKMIMNMGISEAVSLQALAEATRGMREDDIKVAVDLFRESGVLPDKPSHDTNTCHPLTGSWTERILELEEYERIYRENGFTVKVYDGFYNSDKSFPFSVLVRLINLVIPFLGHYLSPFITLVGRKSETK